MNFRSVIGLLSAVATLSCGAIPPVGADEATPVAAAASASADSANIWQDAIESARADYQAAWTSRRSGQLEVAVGICERALERIAQMMALDPDMTSRRELTELQAHIGGLREAAKNDIESASAKASGNEPDEHTLNAPATDGIQPQSNEQVEHYVEFFTGAGRSTFERWLKRSGRYMSLFRSVLQREGLPPDLVHLVFVESGFNVNARSVSAAVGPWQFLRSTGKLFGLAVNQWTDERKDPEKSTVAAARYLKHLYSIFGDWPLALASYNAGEGTVLRAIKAQGTSNYWDLRLPRQTEDYVPQFMAVLEITSDPAKYGFDSVELDDPMEFDEVAFRGAVDLRSIAKLADCTVTELKQLNPAVLNHAANGRDGITTLRVPHGKGEAIQQKMAEGQSLPAVDLTIQHKVRRGETLQKIANKYHVSAKHLALANGIGKKHPLRRGMTLKIPASLEAPAPAVLESSDPRASTDYVPARNLRVPKSLNAQSEAEGRKIVTVKRGETLSTIAESHGVTVNDLKRWNRLKSGKVSRGTRLKIRMTEAGASGAPDEQTPAAAAATAALDTRASEHHDATSDAEYAVASEQSENRSSTKAATTQSSSPESKGVDVSDVSQQSNPSNAKKKSTPAAGSGAKSPNSRTARTVVVRAGDTLSEIADRNGITVTALKRANGLQSDRVRTGQRLKIPRA